MRFGFVIDRWDPARGGAERALALLARHAISRGHEVRVVCLDAVAGAPGEVLRIPRGRRRRGDLERAFARAAVAAARDAGCAATLAIRHVEEIDVLWPHGGLHRATLLAGERSRGAIAGAAARALHRLSHRHRTFLGMERTALEGGARRVWCVSAHVRDEIVAAHPSAAARIEVHANGVDTGRFHPRLRAERRGRALAALGVASDRPVLVFPGGNWRLKGWPTLLDALARMTDVPWTLVAAGDRPPAAAARRAPLRGRSVVAPRLDPEDLHGAADLLVQPTWRDPCSLATLEALASGVPVVTTAANGAADAITDPRAGTVVAPGDAGGLAAALRARLARIAVPETAADDRAAARAAGAARPLEPWLDGLLASLVRCAGATA